MAKAKTGKSNGNGTAAKATEDSKPKGPKYPTIVAKVYAEGMEGPITAEKAKEWLGWTELEQGKDTEIDEQFTDMNGARIVCKNNGRNRPFDTEHALKLAHDILNRNWADSRNSDKKEKVTLNGESIIISESEQVTSGQHRLVGLVFANQLWATKVESDREHWLSLWKEAPSIESIVVFGTADGSRTTRTLDNVKTRSLSDVLFTDGGLFDDFKPNERKNLAKMTEHCIRKMWARTWADKAPFHPRKTHSEFLDFLSRHERIKDCVKHIARLNDRPTEQKDDGKGKKRTVFGKPPIGRYFSPGYAAAWMYFMAASESDVDTYLNGINGDQVGTRREKDGDKEIVDWENWEKAKQFWTILARDGDELHGLREALNSLEKPDMVDPETGEPIEEDRYTDPVSAREEAYLIAAWNLFVKNGQVNDKEELDNTLDWAKKNDDQGQAKYLFLKTHPTVMGSEGEMSLDQGPKKPTERTSSANPETNGTAPLPTEEEIYADGGLADQQRAARESEEEEVEEEEFEEEEEEDGFLPLEELGKASKPATRKR